MIEEKESWLPFSRGLVKHLKDMSGNSVKVFIYILIRAGFRGEMKGKTVISFSDLATELGMHYMTAYRAVKELIPQYLIYVPARNRHEITVFTVQKYKVVADFLADSSTSSYEREEVPPFAPKKGKRKGRASKSAQTDAPESPNKLKKREEELIKLFSEYTQSNMVKSYLTLFKTPEMREDGRNISLSEKITILSELKDLIQSQNDEDGRCTELHLYKAIKRILKQDSKRPLYFNTNNNRGWKQYLTKVLDDVIEKHPKLKSISEYKEFDPNENETT